MKKLSDLQKGWLVGIIEGEGCLTQGHGHIGIRVFSTDEWTIDALLFITGIGRKNYAAAPTANRQDQWGWLVSKREDVEDVYQTIHEYLSPRRRARMQEILAYNSRRPGRGRKGQRRTEPKHGTRYEYDAWRCRCDECVAVERAYRREQYHERKRKKLAAAGNVEIASS